MALEFRERIRQHDPIDEEAVRGALRCYGSLNDLTGTKVALRKLVEALRKILDDDTAQPLPQTVAAYEAALKAISRAGSPG